MKNWEVWPSAGDTLREHESEQGQESVRALQSLAIAKGVLPAVALALSALSRPHEDPEAQLFRYVFARGELSEALTRVRSLGTRTGTDAQVAAQTEVVAELLTRLNDRIAFQIGQFSDAQRDLADDRVAAYRAVLDKKARSRRQRLRRALRRKSGTVPIQQRIANARKTWFESPLRPLDHIEKNLSGDERKMFVKWRGELETALLAVN